MDCLPKPGELYRHDEDKPYQIITIANHTQTGETMVVYQKLYGDFKTYVMPLSVFQEERQSNQLESMLIQKQDILTEDGDVPDLHKSNRVNKNQDSKNQGVMDQDSTYQDNTYQDSINQDSVNQDRANQDRANQDRANQDRANQDSAYQDRANQDSAYQDSAYQDRANQDRANQDSVNQDSANQNNSYLDSTYLNNPDQDSSNQDNTYQQVNSILMEFLDADSFQEKLEVVTVNRKHMDDRLINDMAVSLDCTVDEGPMDKRIHELIYCLRAMSRFEDRRKR